MKKSRFKILLAVFGALILFVSAFTIISLAGETYADITLVENSSSYKKSVLKGNEFVIPEPSESDSVGGTVYGWFDKDGNLIRTISTMPYGNTTYPQYSGPHNSGNEATRAVVYSENSPYIFDMRVNTYKDSVNEFKDASYKTSFWDMNYYYNKLYFSRFDEGQRVLHEEGKEVHTETIWLFKIKED
jgi:hypothetical protein